VYTVFRDRHDMWCAAAPGFRSMLIDPTGWGVTKIEAVHDLMDHPMFHKMADVYGWPLPKLADFFEVQAPEEAEVGFRDL
jgi:hypothetical protein